MTITKVEGNTVLKKGAIAITLFKDLHGNQVNLPFVFSVVSKSDDCFMKIP